MKPGTEMDYKQGQTTVVIAEKDQGSIYRPCAEVSAPSASKKLVVKVILGLVALILVAAVTLTAVYLGGKITKEAVKFRFNFEPVLVGATASLKSGIITRFARMVKTELYFTFRMPDGRTIKEKITVTDTEEDIIVLGQDTRIIYDYKKGYMMTRMKDEGVDKCYVSTFDRTQVAPPAVDVASSMLESNVTMLPETDYYIHKNEIVDAAILSPRSHDMCQGLPVYWTTRSSISNGKLKQTYRQRRGCKRVCKAYCNCCPRDCGVRCSIKCSF